MIHAFNDVGFAALDPKWSGGRPKTITEQARRQICLLARCRPRDMGLPFSAWSLSKLADYVVTSGVVTSISRGIRQILRAAGISWQAAKTWKTSWLNWIEPEFAALRYFALNGTDHRTHADQGDAIAAYLRWHNAGAHPKRNFAPGSVIRTWTSYQNKVA